MWSLICKSGCILKSVSQLNVCFKSHHYFIRKTLKYLKVKRRQLINLWFLLILQIEAQRLPSIPPTAPSTSLKKDPQVLQSTAEPAKTFAQALKPDVLVPQVSKNAAQTSTSVDQKTGNDAATPKSNPPSKNDAAASRSNVLSQKTVESSKSIPESSKNDSKFLHSGVNLPFDTDKSARNDVQNVVLSASEESSRGNLSRWKLKSTTQDGVNSTEKAIAEAMPFFESSPLQTWNLEVMVDKFKTWKEMSASIEKKLIAAFRCDNNFAGIEQIPGG